MDLSRNQPLRDRILIRGKVLAQFLNDAKGSQYQNVLRLFQYCRELQQLLPEIVRAGPLSASDWPTVYCLVDKNKKARRLREKINGVLSRYPFRRIVPAFLKAEDPITLQTDVAPLTKEPVIGATKAIELLLSLAEWGALEELRQCRVCRTWFMATRSDQRDCSVRCNRKRYKLVGEERNAYMREYRKNKKAMLQRQEKVWKEKYRAQNS